MNKSGSGVTFDWSALYHFYDNCAREPFPAKSPAEFWNNRAEDFARKTQHPQHRVIAEDLLKRFKWKSSERVLDVGSGPGTYTLPLAGMVREVVALDVSAEMLQHLLASAAERGIDNIRTIQSYWLDADPSSVTGFDTVICFNALGAAASKENGENDIGETIKRLKNAARRGLVLVPHSDLPVDKEMRKALDLPESFARRERVAMLHLMMANHGLLPDVEVLSRPFFWVFRSLPEALEKIGQRLGILEDQSRMKILSRLLSERMETCGDQLIFQYPVAQTLFSWVLDDS